MHRFYLDGAAETGALVPMAEEDARHCLRVLRLRPGDAVEALADGRRFAAVIEGVENGVTLRIGEERPSTESRLRVTLFQGLPKADKMELICQKAVELGADAVVPVLMTRSVSRPDAADGRKKRDRWQKIAREAGKQAGRCSQTRIAEPVSFAACVKELAALDAAIVPWEEEGGYTLRRFAQEHPAITTLGIVIGPEGGITAEEIGAMKAAGCQPVTLGPRILRTETAGLAALSAAMCLYGEWG